TQSHLIFYFNSHLYCIVELLLRKQPPIKQETLAIKRDSSLVIWRVGKDTFYRVLNLWVAPFDFYAICHIVDSILANRVSADPTIHGLFPKLRNRVAIQYQNSDGLA